MHDSERSSRPENPPEKVVASRRRFVALLLVAFVPIFIAYAAFFYFPAWAPTGTTNQGELISPSLDGATMSEDLSTFSSWVLIQPVTGDCAEQCQELLFLSRQVVTGLGKDANRIQRVVMVSTDPAEELTALLEAEHPDVKIVYGDSSVVPDAANSNGPALLLMDPNRNVMMRYALEKAGKPMLRDLKHLMRISNIG